MDGNWGMEWLLIATSIVDHFRKFPAFGTNPYVCWFNPHNFMDSPLNILKTNTLEKIQGHPIYIPCKSHINPIEIPYKSHINPHEIVMESRGIPFKKPVPPSSLGGAARELKRAMTCTSSSLSRPCRIATWEVETKHDPWRIHDSTNDSWIIYIYFTYLLSI